MYSLNNFFHYLISCQFYFFSFLKFVVLFITCIQNSSLCFYVFVCALLTHNSCCGICYRTTEWWVLPKQHWENKISESLLQAKSVKRNKKQKHYYHYFLPAWCSHTHSKPLLRALLYTTLSLAITSSYVTISLPTGVQCVLANSANGPGHMQ